MTYQPLEMRSPRTTAARPSTWLAAVVLTLFAIAGCSGATSTPTTTPGGGLATGAPTSTSEPPSAASGAAACIDAETAAIIQSLRNAAPGDVQTIITEQGDTLIAGLQGFSPPPDAASWRDELVTAIEDGDAAAVQAKLAAIGSEVTLESC